MNCFKGFAKTISFLFYIFEIYVRLFLGNTLLQILLIDKEWYNEWQKVTKIDKNNNEWYNECQRVTTSDKEWQWVDNTWQ